MQNFEQGKHLTHRIQGVINCTKNQKSTKKQLTLILTRSNILLIFDRMDFKSPPQSDTEKLQRPFTAMFIKKEYSPNIHLGNVDTIKKKITLKPGLSSNQMLLQSSQNDVGDQPNIICLSSYLILLFYNSKAYYFTWIQFTVKSSTVLLQSNTVFLPKFEAIIVN